MGKKSEKNFYQVGPKLAKSYQNLVRRGIVNSVADKNAHNFIQTSTALLPLTSPPRCNYHYNYGILDIPGIPGDELLVTFLDKGLIFCKNFANPLIQLLDLLRFCHKNFFHRRVFIDDARQVGLEDRHFHGGN